MNFSEIQAQVDDLNQIVSDRDSKVSSLTTKTRHQIASEHRSLRFVGFGRESLVLKSPFHKDRLISIGVKKDELYGVVPFLEYKHLHRIVENLLPGQISHIGTVWGYGYRNMIRDEVVGYDTNLKGIADLSEAIDQNLREAGIRGIEIDYGTGSNAIEQKDGKLVYVDTLTVKSIDDIIHADLDKLRKHFFDKCRLPNEEIKSVISRWNLVHQSILLLQESSVVEEIFKKAATGGSTIVSEYCNDDIFHDINKRKESDRKASIERIQKWLNGALEYKEKGNIYYNGRWYKENGKQ